jgi:hypothetical protein
MKDMGRLIKEINDIKGQPWLSPLLGVFIIDLYKEFLETFKEYIVNIEEDKKHKPKYLNEQDKS